MEKYGNKVQNSLSGYMKWLLAVSFENTCFYSIQCFKDILQTLQFATSRFGHLFAPTFCGFTLKVQTLTFPTIESSDDVT